MMTEDISKQDDARIRILIADDHPLLREALKNILERQPDFRVVGEASDGEEAINLAARLLPEVAILDINMPKVNGIEATRQIKTSHPDVAILVLTIYDDIPHILAIIEAGAAGYLTKKVFGDEVVNAVRNILAGDTVLVPAISRKLINHVLRHKTKSQAVFTHHDISKRELEVLTLAAMGKSNQDIAQVLSITSRTVKAYLTDIFSKLNVSSRTEAVVTALKSGIIDLDDIGSSDG